ncbi:hypothetical protein EJ05DRAFT_480237 [Pseudovirgaria hyperparasitica]|uniref:RelA/SpoT domain-containing protein n=1 Tax=Pseudovirgaria hyperparasitica TaxID=470096 RepID=A0A6A6VU82_9PEZI|nr:uncharacterized protein EJ05DRAFT_480237 [Pseudovirgaria hyperparasitica]KAF2753773.1 hypothetical protein EJ05DRAFT_480237 [Pseudovirgaria hyperparasitica]
MSRTLQRRPIEALPAPQVRDGIEIIESFMKRYERTSRDWYENIAQKARSTCEKLLEGRVEAMYEHRAKDPKSLRDKLYKRHPDFVRKSVLDRYGTRKAVPGSEKGYRNHEDIKEDVIDFAGVRIIIYFPHADQWNVVHSMIKNAFDVRKEPEIDDIDSANVNLLYPGLKKRHYRVNIREEEFETGHDPNDICEIQVRSTAMHAWAMISHKHFYKPQDDFTLSGEEKDILISLNGHVHSQELLLGHLWELRRNRVTPFRSKHELGKYLEDNIPQPEVNFERKQKIKSNNRDIKLISNNGTLEILRRFLELAGKDTPEKLEPVLQSLDFSDLKAENDSPRRMIKDRFFAHQKLKPSVYIIKHILDKERLAGSAIKYRYTRYSSYSAKFAVVASSLSWVHKLFMEYQIIEELLCDNENQHEFAKYMDFIYNSPDRTTILEHTEEDMCTPQHKAAIDGLWEWFEKHESPAFALVFEISRIGVLEDLPRNLSKIFFSIRYTSQ